MSAKAEAQRALTHAITRLSAPEPIDSLNARLLAATLVYAAEQVTAIQEVQRARRQVSPLSMRPEPTAAEVEP